MKTLFIITILIIFAILLVKAFFKIQYHTIRTIDKNNEFDVKLYYSLESRLTNWTYKNYITIY